MDVALIPERNLLEVGALPFGELVRFASREGRRPRPIYQIHKWFARRLGCSFRAVLVGAVSEPTADFWKAYYETANLQGFTVLDPFVGGGTSVVEAARLGASAIGVDVDPIACAVTNAELTAAKLDDLMPTLRALQESVGKTMAPLHAIKSPDGTRLTAVHYFWVQVVACPSCEKVGEAHPNYVLAEEAGQMRWAFCRKCHEPHALKASQKSFSCPSCKTKTVLDTAPVRNGTYTCPHCDERTPLIAVGRKTKQPPTWCLFAIEASPRTSGRAVPMKERVFLRATKVHHNAVKRASKALQQELAADPGFLPRHIIEEKHRSDSRLTDYGYRRWSQLFNDRQLLHLGRLAREIKKLPHDERRAFGLLQQRSAHVALVHRRERRHPICAGNLPLALSLCPRRCSAPEHHAPTWAPWQPPSAARGGRSNVGRPPGPQYCSSIASARTLMRITTLHVSANANGAA